MSLPLYFLGNWRNRDFTVPVPPPVPQLCLCHTALYSTTSYSMMSCLGGNPFDKYKHMVKQQTAAAWEVIGGNGSAVSKLRRLRSI